MVDFLSFWDGVSALERGMLNRHEDFETGSVVFGTVMTLEQVATLLAGKIRIT